MKTWAYVLIAVAVLAAGAVLMSLPVTWEQRSVEAVPDDAAQTVAETAKEVEPMTEIDWEAFDRRWSGAPDAVRALAREIAEGGTPDAEQLQALGPDALSRGYPAPALDFTRNGTAVPYQATLLIEAATAYNLAATQALLAAGADPKANHNEVAFVAATLRTRGAPDFMLFPDHDETLPFLRAYLEAGADPNALRHGFLGETPLTRADLERNLGATLLMLEFGANPWQQLPFPDLHQNDGYMAKSILEDRATSGFNRASLEVLFRWARSGHLRPGPEAQVAAVYDIFAEKVDRLDGATGPDARHSAWRLHQILQWVGTAMDLQDAYAALQAKLPAFDYETDGGWYLAEDEVHSKYDAPLSTPDAGSEIWGP
ncbi:MAG: hypothetical protein AAFN94_10665 [Pseudomonadota bacterium]